jgi:hypothetical protein
MSFVKAIASYAGVSFNIPLSVGNPFVRHYERDLDPLRVPIFQEMSHQAFAACSCYVMLLVEVHQQVRVVLDVLLIARVWPEQI